MPDWAAPVLVLHLVMPPSTLRAWRVQAVIDHLTRARPRRCARYGSRGSMGS
ncbi:hypothetical protein F4693_003140 [Sphingomonas endophytica]|uniref:Uncharacterized protein n=1 Tax=Sphingomonas endophytica TaxID=869719 RepID=A0A7X0JEH0_9SPHN|nr:hypothetical protein [Sphingomonas endophytica]MBB6506143.1 hypothetical protein [Sphingomonas endophytica]